MPTINWNLQFLNHNATRAYPLASDSTRTSTSEEFVIPDSFLVELSLALHSGMTIQPGQFFVQQITADALGYAVRIAYQIPGGAILPVAAFSVAAGTHTTNKSYTLTGLGQFYDAYGWATVGKLEEIAEQPAGLWQFALADGRLEPDCLRPQIRGVSGIYVRNGNTTTGPYTGDIVLAAGARQRLDVLESRVVATVAGEVTDITGDTISGYTITVGATEHVTDPGHRLVVLLGDEVEIADVLSEASTEIQLNAMNGEGFDDTCLCTDTTSEPIRFLNGVGPDADSRINLIGNTCITWEDLEHALLVKDECSEPCCGSPELEAITASLEQFGDKATTLENFLVRLESSTSQMDMTVLGSKLGDRSCTS